jgi:hypothetical protein
MERLLQLANAPIARAKQMSRRNSDGCWRMLQVAKGGGRETRLDNNIAEAMNNG